MQRLLERDSLVGMVLGPIVWAVHFLVVYTLLIVACAFGLGEGQSEAFGALSALLVGITAVALAVIGLRGLWVYRDWRASGRDEAVAADAFQERRGFMSMTALALHALAALAILWVTLPVLMLPPCR